MMAAEEVPAEDSRQAAREAAERLLGALDMGGWGEVADAAEAAYLTIGRLAVLARAETRVK